MLVLFQREREREGTNKKKIQMKKEEIKQKKHSIIL